MRRARRARKEVVVSPVDPRVALKALMKLWECERVTVRPEDDSTVAYYI